MPDYRITGGGDLVEYFVFGVETPDDALEAWANDSGYASFDAMCEAGVVESDAVEVQPLSDVDEDKIPDDVQRRHKHVETERRALRRASTADENPIPDAQREAEADLEAEGWTLERTEPLEDAPGRVTYWADDDTDATVVKQVHPNGDVRTYTGDEWDRVQKYLDEE